MSFRDVVNNRKTDKMIKRIIGKETMSVVINRIGGKCLAFDFIDESSINIYSRQLPCSDYLGISDILKRCIHMYEDYDDRRDTVDKFLDSLRITKPISLLPKDLQEIYLENLMTRMFKEYKKTYKENLESELLHFLK